MQQSPATEYSYSSDNQQQCQPSTTGNLGTEEEIKYAQAIFNKMVACIQARGDKGVDYVKNWMSNRHCCVSGFDTESDNLYIYR